MVPDVELGPSSLGGRGVGGGHGDLVEHRRRGGGVGEGRNPMDRCLGTEFLLSKPEKEDLFERPEVLHDKIWKLEEKISTLIYENTMLRNTRPKVDEGVEPQDDVSGNNN